MIKLLTREDKKSISVCSRMLQDMYEELNPVHCAKNSGVYGTAINNHVLNDYVYLDDQERGMFIMQEEYNPLTPNLVRWSGTVVYIKPEFRGTRLLKEMYDEMYKNHKGQIMGFTAINSKHIEVLDKRHTCIGKVYILKES